MSQLIDQLPFCTFELDDEKRLVFMNRRSTEVLGSRSDRILGQPYERTLEIIGFDKDQIDRLTDELAMATERVTTRQTRLVYHRPNHPNIYYMIDIIPFQKGRGENRYCLMAHEANDLHRSNQKVSIYKSALEASSNGILIIDAEHRNAPIIFSNPAFTLITGYTDEELQGRSVFSAKEGSWPTFLTRRIAVGLGQQASTTRRAYIRGQDGAPVWLKVLPPPLPAPTVKPLTI